VRACSFLDVVHTQSMNFSMVEMVCRDRAVNTDKFYRLLRAGGCVFINYGRHGTVGVFVRRVFSSDYEASSYFSDVAATKRDRGYHDVAGYTGAYGTVPATSEEAFLLADSTWRTRLLGWLGRGDQSWLLLTGLTTPAGDRYDGFVSEVAHEIGAWVDPRGDRVVLAGTNGRDFLHRTNFERGGVGGYREARIFSWVLGPYDPKTPLEVLAVAGGLFNPGVAPTDWLGLGRVMVASRNADLVARY
jgi:predicted DNA-binding WGR domain protein